MYSQIIHLWLHCISLCSNVAFFFNNHFPTRAKHPLQPAATIYFFNNPWTAYNCFKPSGTTGLSVMSFIWGRVNTSSVIGWHNLGVRTHLYIRGRERDKIPSSRKKFKLIHTQSTCTKVEKHERFFKEEQKELHVCLRLGEIEIEHQNLPHPQQRVVFMKCSFLFLVLLFWSCYIWSCIVALALLTALVLGTLG